MQDIAQDEGSIEFLQAAERKIVGEKGFV